MACSPARRFDLSQEIEKGFSVVAGIGDHRLFGVRRRQIAGCAVPQKPVQGRLNFRFYRLRTTIPPIGVKRPGVDDIMFARLSFRWGRQELGTRLAVWLMR